MPPARLRPLIQPRILRRTEISAYLSHSETWFCSQRERLEALGFPKFMVTLDGYDKAAIDLWLDKMSGIEDETGFEAEASE